MACIVLASGLSRRFGGEDKLLANLKGQALLAYCLDAARETGFDGYYVVTPKGDARADMAIARGFTVIDNPNPSAGQGATLACGVQYVLSKAYDGACILLGDMPFITAEYLTRLKHHSAPFDATFSQSGGRDHPPAIFNAKALKTLTTLRGDQGARSVDLSLFSVGAISLSPEMAVDFDLPEDFNKV